MENEMEEGEDNMIHEVNEDNGEMVESNKDEYPFEYGRKERRKSY